MQYEILKLDTSEFPLGPNHTGLCLLSRELAAKIVLAAKSQNFSGRVIESVGDLKLILHYRPFAPGIYLEFSSTESCSVLANEHEANEDNNIIVTAYEFYFPTHLVSSLDEALSKLSLKFSI